MDHGAKTVELKVRISPRHAEWLRALADERFDGNMSAAVRQAFTDARLLDMARNDFAYLVTEQGLRLPYDEHGMTSTLETILRFRGWIDADSIEQAREEGLL